MDNENSSPLYSFRHKYTWEISSPLSYVWNDWVLLALVGNRSTTERNGKIERHMIAQAYVWHLLIMYGT